MTFELALGMCIGLVLGNTLAGLIIPDRTLWDGFCIGLVAAGLVMIYFSCQTVFLGLIRGQIL